MENFTVFLKILVGSRFKCMVEIAKLYLKINILVSSYLKVLQLYAIKWRIWINFIFFFRSLIKIY